MRAMTGMMGAIVLIFSGPAAAETLHVYGPGGPSPAMKEAAAAYQAQTGTEVHIVSGPTKDWLANAKTNADLIYSGSEAMMTDLVVAMDGRLQQKTIQPLYLRVSNILVRPGNPRKIDGFDDLLKPGLRVLVVQGAGQTGLWEDMAGRTGNIRTVRALRSNIVNFATTSADAKKAWTDDQSIDAWIIWGIWQKANPTLADAVNVEKKYRIYRDTGVGLTTRGLGNRDAGQFLSFLSSPAGAAIFQKWGWITHNPSSQPKVKR